MRDFMEREGDLRDSVIGKGFFRERERERERLREGLRERERNVFKASGG